jgi:DNA-binding transcriptional regulator/RsmH inhibitor MraZ
MRVVTVDTKGRMTLPVEFKEYLTRLGDTKVFITTTDLKLIKIFPLSAWDYNENFFEEQKEDAVTAAQLKFLANDMGGDSGIDSNGRLLLPQQLRDHFGLENTQVRVECQKGIFKVYTQQYYEEYRAAALQGLQEKNVLMEAKGMR